MSRRKPKHNARHGRTGFLERIQRATTLDEVNQALDIALQLPNPSPKTVRRWTAAAEAAKRRLGL